MKPNNSLAIQTKVLYLRLEAQALMLKCIKSKGSESYFNKLHTIDQDLALLIKSDLKFEFISHINKGSTLLVGEGNLSFAFSLAAKALKPYNIVATTYESSYNLDCLVRENSRKLEILGAKVLHEVDATKLSLYFGSQKFYSIIFQFPHTGKQDYIDDKNPNFELLCNFLISAKQRVHPNGSIIVSYVDSSYYNSLFNFQKLKEELNFNSIEKYKFDPSDFPKYKHRMTNSSESGIINHDKFATVVFRL